MSTIISHGLVFMTIIIGRKQQDALVTALLDAGIHLINTTYGRGTVKAKMLKSAFGLVPEEHKVVVTCLLAHEKTGPVFHMLTDQFYFDRPNTGIAFTVPVERLSF